MMCGTHSSPAQLGGGGGGGPSSVLSAQCVRSFCFEGNA